MPPKNEYAHSSCGELQEYKTGTKAEIIEIGVDTAIKFHTCKEKHNALVKERENIDKAIEKFNGDVAQ